MVLASPPWRHQVMETVGAIFGQRSTIMGKRVDGRTHERQRMKGNDLLLLRSASGHKKGDGGRKKQRFEKVKPDSPV